MIPYVLVSIALFDWLYFGWRFLDRSLRYLMEPRWLALARFVFALSACASAFRWIHPFYDSSVTTASFSQWLVWLLDAFFQIALSSLLWLLPTLFGLYICTFLHRKFMGTEFIIEMRSGSPPPSATPPAPDPATGRLPPTPSTDTDTESDTATRPLS